MFFATLADVETLMHGHEVAFLQLVLLTDRSAAFNQSFGAWLAATRGSSVAAGWAIAIEELAREEGADKVELFFEIAEDFIGSWCQPLAK